MQKLSGKLRRNSAIRMMLNKDGSEAVRQLYWYSSPVKVHIIQMGGQ